jgi:hypothetical protein
MTAAIRAAYRRARRTGRIAYTWSTYARTPVSDDVPDRTACMGTYIAVDPSGAITRRTYDATVGVWRITGTAIVDDNGRVIAAEDTQ